MQQQTAPPPQQQQPPEQPPRVVEQPSPPLQQQEPSPSSNTAANTNNDVNYNNNPFALLKTHHKLRTHAATPTVSDLELVWNIIKVVLYFGSIIICCFPALVDACSFPPTEAELDESERGGSTASPSSAQQQQKSTSTTANQQQPSRWQRLKRRVSRTVTAIKTTTLHTLRISLVLACAFACTWSTWSYILQFLMEDRERFSSLRQWVARSDWMVASYESVSATPAQWFFSARLLYFVVSLVLFLVVEHARCPARQRFAPLCNIIVGCGVAISASLPLALSAVFVSMHSRPHRAARHTLPFRWLVVAPLVVAYLCVMLIPAVVVVHADTEIESQAEKSSGSGAYGIVLGLLHLCVSLPVAVAQFFPGYVTCDVPSAQSSVIPEQSGSFKDSATNVTFNDDDITSSISAPLTIVPLRMRPTAQREWRERTARHLWVPVAFGSLAVANAVSFVVDLLAVVHSSSPDQLFATLAAAVTANPCQISITLDVAQCSLIVIAFLWLMCPRLRWLEQVVLTLSVPSVGLGFAFSAALAIQELRECAERLTTDFETLFVPPFATAVAAAFSAAQEEPETPFRLAPSSSKKKAPHVASKTAATKKNPPLDISPDFAYIKRLPTTDFDSTFDLTSVAPAAVAKVGGNSSNNINGAAAAPAAASSSGVAAVVKRRPAPPSSNSGAAAAAASSTNTHNGTKRPSNSLVLSSDDDDSDDSEEERRRLATKLLKRRPLASSPAALAAAAGKQKLESSQLSLNSASQRKTSDEHQLKKKSSSSNNKKSKRSSSTENNVAAESDKSSGISGCFSRESTDDEENEEEEEFVAPQPNPLMHKQRRK